jgi:hypothetical protein
MRFACLWVVFGIALTSQRAEACAFHAQTPKAPSKDQLARAKPLPRRIVIVEIDMGRRFVGTLENLGHHVDTAKDMDVLRALLAANRYDVAVVPLALARELLDEVAIGMVVPVVAAGDDPALADELEFHLPADPSEVRAQIHELHRAFGHLPVVARR